MRLEKGRERDDFFNRKDENVENTVLAIANRDRGKRVNQ